MKPMKPFIPSSPWHPLTQETFKNTLLQFPEKKVSSRKLFDNMHKSIYYLIFLVLLVACKEQDKPSTKVVEKKNILEGTENSLVSPKDILRHMKVLSSDEFQGRKPCTDGEVKTVKYLVDALKAMGVEGANKGAYTQDVPLVDIISHPSKVMEVHSDFGGFDLIRNKDYVIHSQRKQEEVELKNSDLVWCGYGIVAPELGWNDFDKVNMKGKTAVVMINDPDYGLEGEKRKLFKGDEMTYYGRWTYKYEEADRQGADGLLIIHETTLAGYPWFVVQSSWSGSQQGLAAVDRSNDCAIKGWLSLDAAKKLFKNSKMDISTEIRRARERNFSPQAFFANANVKIKNEYTECLSQNVVGWIEGSKYPDEYVVYTAHWDHLGIGAAVEGDSIYNGALDNASGVAALLSIAKNFTKPENKPERSVVFLFVTAEEQGLLGSEHYMNYPLFPIDKTVCNLNLDGVNPAGPMNDVTITGLGHSTMDDYAEKLAKEKGRYILGEQEPEKGYFFRSDHFNFAKHGVPAFYGAGSYDHREKGKEYAKQFLDDYVATHYHAPSDEFSEEEWDLRGFIEDADFYYELGQRMANSQEWPEWKRGSEFSRKKK